MVTLRHVYGHTGHEGNEGADELARGGTVQRAIPDRDWEADRQRVERKIDSKLGAQSEKRRSRILEDHLEVQVCHYSSCSLLATHYPPIGYV